MSGCFTLSIAALSYMTLFTVFPRCVFSMQDSLEPVQLYIEAGSELHLDCVVSDAVEVGNLTAGDIVWRRSSSPFPSELYSAVNDTLSHLSFNVTFDDSGDYSCVLPGNTTDELATYVVQVGLKPSSLRLECIVRKPDDFYWCSWKETVNTHLPTVHTFQFRKKGRPWQDCPDLTSKGNNTCYITRANNQGGLQVVRVKSVNGLGQSYSRISFWSNQHVVVNPPRLVALRPGTEETSLKVRWNHPEDWFVTEASALVYKIRFKKRDCVDINSTCCCWDEFEIAHSEAFDEDLGSYTLRNLDPYTEYTVQIAARFEYSKEWSVWTTENSSLTREREPSEPVQGLTVINQTDHAEDPVYLRDVYVAWEFLEVEYQNGPILDYQVSAEPQQNADEIGIHKLVSNETTCTLRGLRKYSSYDIHVRAHNNAGMGPEATKSIADRTTAPNAPDEVTAVPLTTTAIRVHWKEPSHPNGYILGYIVQWRKGNTNGQMEQYTTHNASKRSHVLEGLETYALYEVSVKANNSRGSGGAAYLHRGARTLQGVPNAAPSSLKVKPVRNLPESLMLTWESLPVANIQGVLKGYTISYCKTNISGCSVRHHNVTRPDQTTYTMNRLAPSTNYTVWIAAYTELGIGPDSNHVTAVTGEEGLAGYLLAFSLLVALLLISITGGALCIWRNFECLFRTIPEPKYGKNLLVFKRGTDTNLRRINSRVEGEQYDEIATEVITGKFQSANELILPDIHLKKCVRTESGDSGVPPSPASDTLDFDAIRDKLGVVTSDGEDSVFLGEEQDDTAMELSLPSEKLTVRIGRVEEGATRHFPRGAISPSSPMESVGSYTRVGEFQFSIKKAGSSSALRLSAKVSFDLPEVVPELTIIENPSQAKENLCGTQSEELTAPGDNPPEASEDVSPSIEPQKSPIGPVSPTCPGTTSIMVGCSSPMHDAEASVNASPSLPPTSATSPVSPYVTTLETQMFLYPCENGHPRQIIKSMGSSSFIDGSKSPNPQISSTALTCKSHVKNPDQTDTSIEAQEQISGCTSDCRRDSLNPTPRLSSSPSSPEVDKTKPTVQNGYTQMSAIRDPRQQKSSTLIEQCQVGTADSDSITQLEQPSQCSPVVKLEGSNPSSHSPYTLMSPVHLNRQHNTFEGADTMPTDRDGFRAPNSQFSSSSADQHHPRRLTCTTHSSLPPLILPYVKMESLGTTQQKTHNDDLGLTTLSSQSPEAPSKQQHLINSSYIHVAASEHPGREPHEDTAMHKPISLKTDPPRFGDKTEMEISGSVLAPSGYVQVSFTGPNSPDVCTSAPTLPPGTSSTSDPEDDVQEYWKVSAPVPEPGSVLALLQAHSNTTSLSSDSVIADNTRTGRGTAGLSRAQTSIGYVQ